MNLSKCRRCKKDVVAGPHATNKRFCSQDCYDTWWSEYKSKGVTRGEVAVKIWGEVPLLELSEPQKSWVAALIDGEGTIGVWKEVRLGNKSGVRYRAVVQVSNSNMQLLETFQVCVRGYAHRKGRKQQNPHHKPVFGVTVSRRAVQSLLEQIKPFLVAKRQQAEVALEFCRVMEATPMRASINHDVFESLYQECKRLNRRGIIVQGG